MLVFMNGMTIFLRLPMIQSLKITWSITPGISETCPMFRPKNTSISDRCVLQRNRVAQTEQLNLIMRVMRTLKHDVNKQTPTR